MAGRPAETFASWEKFFVFTIQPFTKKQVELLIAKISYDEEIKGLFRKKLSEGLYETHKEFLTNPLLTIMMLITLEQFAEVPAKIHLFYEYAFEALFGRHDATKGGGFQRKRHTALALDDFKRLFSYFCAIAYMKQTTTFSAGKVLEIIQQSINSSQIVADMQMIALNDQDSKWLADAYFAKFVQIESELLPKLRDEVKSRVEQRKQGVNEIFASS